ncbi:DUF3352 domain-containing protein [Oscillatoriales cyanobacterium LEGE 11467]|uniref:DUF3352 domain-containing protein n=1 Tax=Zarconia navalis LEGE 11467 TaxID=1828826 RepID=A0A928VVW7_9CYAN|nr:DUF3352 domain-containing protein [Zarconia navalis]MBE9039196.1 DUF3352 domain-containing protein [Zarconia navalis LEGE 11467]
MSESTKKSGLGCLPLAGIAAVLAGGAAAGYFFFLRGAPTGDAGVMASAEVVPESALMAAHISTDSTSWSELKQFGTPEAQEIVKKGIESFEQDLQADANLNFETDLKPWMGDVMLAIVPPAESAQNAGEPQPLIVVGIKDKVKALAFAQKMKEEGGENVSEIDYQGVTISEISQPDETIYTAVLDDFVTISFDLATLQQAIDTSKGQPSFASQPEAAKILRNGAELDNTLAQLYIADYRAFIAQVAEQSPENQELPSQTLKQLEQVDSIVMGVGTDDRGLRLTTRVELDPDYPQPEFAPASGKPIAQFPAETIALASGQGIGRIWSQLVEQSEDDPQTKQAVDGVRQTFGQIDLDADRVFGWMDGEFALGLVPSREGILANVGFGGALTIDTSDRAAAEETLEKVGKVLQDSIPVPVNIAQKDVKGTQMTQWSVPQVSPGPLVGYGWLDDDSLLLAIGGPIADAMLPTPATPLDTSEGFTTSTDTLPQTNLGYFYANFEQAMTLVNSLPPEATGLTPEAKAILDSIRSLGVTATVQDKSTSTLEMALPLVPNQ